MLREMTDHEPQPKHAPSAREFWSRYLMGSFVVVVLTAAGFSQQFGFRLASPTFGDYWVARPAAFGREGGAET